MKKILLTSIVILLLGVGAIAQKKTAIKQHTINQSKSIDPLTAAKLHDAKIIALKKDAAKRNYSEFLVPRESETKLKQ